MRAKVIQAFRDKSTNEFVSVGEVIETSKGRFEEINSTAFGVILEEIKEEPEKKKK